MPKENDKNKVNTCYLFGRYRFNRSYLNQIAEHNFKPSKRKAKEGKRKKEKGKNSNSASIGSFQGHYFGRPNNRATLLFTNQSSRAQGAQTAQISPLV